jgi:hypothetical protein
MNLTDFKNEFNGGTRPNRFLVTGAVGEYGEAATTHTFHIRSTFLPPVTNITLTLNAYGRKVNIPGDREYSPWQMTIYDDIKNSEQNQSNPTHLWDLFTKWQNEINMHNSNRPDANGAPGAIPFLQYKRDWTIQHLDLNGNLDPLKKFELRGCWPKTVSDIDLNMTRRNFMNTFSVIMLYDEIRINDTDLDTTDAGQRLLS